MIRLRSIYNVDTFKKFQRYMLRYVFVLAYICGILLIGIGVLFAFLSKIAYEVYIVMGIFLPLIVHVFHKMLEVQTISKNIYLKSETIQIFTFDEEGFELEQISKFDAFKEKYLYKDIYSIVKYKRYYFAYINRVQAFIINNEDYIIGNEEELDKLFSKVKGENFIVKRNSKKRAFKKKIET